MSGNAQWANNEIKRIRDVADEIIFDVEDTWFDYKVSSIEAHYRKLYYEIVEKYQELEKTRKYVAAEHVLIATGLYSFRDITFSRGGGVTSREDICTHGIGWGIEFLLRNLRKNPEPFSLKLLIAGFS